MTTYNISKLILLFAFILNLAACSDSGPEQSVQLEQSELYKLAPLNQPAVKLISKNSNSNNVSPSKGLLLPDIDVLNTKKNNLIFDLYYTSSNNHDNYQSLGQGWRHSYVKQIDPQRSKNITIQSKTYDSLEQACLQGWNDIKTVYYQGLLNLSHAEYNVNDKLCVIKNKEGRIQTNLIIWDEDNLPKSKTKQLSLPDGNTLLFTKKADNTKLWEPVNGTVSQLIELENGWKYQDQNDVVEYYNKDGYLSNIDTYGNVTQIDYNEKNWPVSIMNKATNQSISLNYDGDGRLWSIKNNLNDKTLNIYFEKDYLDTFELGGKIEKNYQYNKGALSKRVITTPLNEVTTNFKYDRQGRLVNKKTTSNSNRVNKKATIQSASTTVSTQAIANEINFVYEANKIIVSDQDGQEAKFTIDLINGKEVVTDKEVDGVIQKFEFNEDGNLTQVASIDAAIQANNKSTIASATSLPKSNTYQVNLSYNPKKQLNNLQITSKQKNKSTKKQASSNKNTTFSAEYLYQDNRFNRPTFKKIKDDLEIIEFNANAQVAKSIHAKLNSNNKATALSASTPKPTDYQVINSIKYDYNDKGQIKKIQQKNKITEFSYKDNGRLDTILLPNGKVIKKQPFKQSSLQQYDDIKVTAQSLSETQKNNLPKIGADGVTTRFIGGAAPTLKGLLTGEGEIPVKNYFDRKQYKGDTTYDVHNSFNFFEGLTIFQNISKGEKTILIGHSWGADEILDYGDFQPVDLAVTVDPVGFIFSMGFRVNTHINVTADPGFPMSISLKRFKICRCCCGGCCTLYGWVPVPKLNWNFSDWIAFAGLKYVYYFQNANLYADDGFTYSGHHEDFEKMLKMVGERYPSIGIR